MFNIKHGMAPCYLFSPRVRDQNIIGTRSGEYDVVVPRVQDPGSSTFAFTAAKLWNALPDNIQSIDTLRPRNSFVLVVANFCYQVQDQVAKRILW